MGLGPVKSRGSDSLTETGRPLKGWMAARYLSSRGYYDLLRSECFFFPLGKRVLFVASNYRMPCFL